ncbi:TonB-dependent receptor [Hankyongella ginsenosidimutans]|uniref:TonB-dependent receptor n=1 Tax=Hankyongella ginsenosidimutans TaxID=1763828 RepID=UPI001FE7ADBB|nr:TonB-dependent receptor [Hankyongella ginsenosidimutans]
MNGQYRNVQFDLSGDGVINDVDRALKLPRLSPWTYGVGLTYDQQLGELGTATARVSFTHRDKAAFTDNNVGFLQGRYARCEPHIGDRQQALALLHLWPKPPE